jgi:predicted ArsR family transcriptional regulator
MERLDGLGASELRDTLLHARGQEGPVSADDVAHAFAIHRNVARGRLERLVEAGLLDPSFERRSGRSGPGAGRPAKVYSVAPELEAVEFPARRLEHVVGHLIEALPADGRADTLLAAGIRFGTELADTAGLAGADELPQAMENLACALRRLGYQTSVATTDGDEVVLSTPTCPLRPLVVAERSAVDLDRGMWRGLAAAAFPSVPVAGIDCDARACGDQHGSCKVHLSFQRPLTRKGSPDA